MDLSNSRRIVSGKGRDKGSFLKRGGYSMTGVSEEVQDNAEMGKIKGRIKQCHINPE